MSEAVAGLNAAIAHGVRMLGARPDLAEQQAREILQAAPGHPAALLLLAQARRLQGAAGAALEVLEPLTASQPRWPPAHLELGLARADLGDSPGALKALDHAVSLKPDLPEAWSAISQLRRMLGDSRGADQAQARYLGVAIQDPVLLEAGAALAEGKLAVAEHSLRDLLRVRPDETAALRMLAEIATRLGRYEDAEALLIRCLDLAPEFTAARHNLAVALYRQTKAAQALTEVETLLKDDPKNPGYRNLQAAALGQMGEYEKTIRVYETLLREYPAQPKGWMSYGHALKTVGRQADAISAYRKALELLPSLGEAWWSLANLKTVKFSDDDRAAMQAQLDRTDISEEDRFHLDFALGKAFEDMGSYAESFAHYDAGNSLRRQGMGYDAEETTSHLQRSKALFSRGFFEARTGFGTSDPDPIFILGLPRSGSTLIEQILASHSAIEGTMELPDIPAMAKRLGARRRSDEDSRLPRGPRRPLCRGVQGHGRRLSGPHPASEKAGSPVLHRQDAEQLRPCGFDPSDPARGQDHRRPPPSHGMLLFRLQAALRPWAGLYL